MTQRIPVPAGMTTPTRSASGWNSRVSLTLDDDGFLGRECPIADCLAYFKLHVDEYPEARAKRALSCPVCGRRGDDESFMTPDQVRRTKAAIREPAMGAVQAAFRRRPGTFETEDDPAGDEWSIGRCQEPC